MSNRKLDIPSAHRYPFLLSLAVLLAVVAVFRFVEFDWCCCDKSPIDEGYPDFSIIGWARLAVLALCFFSLTILFSGAFSVRFSLGEKKKAWPVYLTGYALGALTIFFTLLLWYFPTHFNVLSHEDSLVEWASFVFLIVSSALFVIAAFRCRREEGQRFPWAMLTCAGFAFVFWFVGMEEVSWFQRQIGLETPDVLFEGNIQKEFNLHNFFTVGFEILYYFGTFVFFIILPFLRVIFSDWVEQNRYFDTFVPQPFVAIIGAMSCGYNFEMWNIFPVQSCFVGTVVVLGFFLLASQRLQERVLICFTGVILVASQWVFLLGKGRYERIWEVTEYKELFITVGFVAYAISTLRRILANRRELA